VKTKSAKAKARRLQDAVVNAILWTFLDLEPDDVRAAVMGESGADVKLSPLGRDYFPYAVEAKNTERLDVWGALKQAEAHAEKEGGEPVVVFKRNGSEIYVIQKFNAWLRDVS